ncbi:uncharacterized protein JCM10292_001080 [Rhodotorula paludigena]|uniref:uncharacterized protein n=1 Tax=Rhodotorula paludigena TaxID=86838 RepID=UPI0031757FB2
MPPLAYPLEDNTARLEQAFEVAYDSRWLGYTSSRGHRTISTAVWAWAKERYLDRISRRKWATLSTWTQMQCMAEWALLVDEVEKGKVRSPDDLWKVRMTCLDAIATGAASYDLPKPSPEVYRRMLQSAQRDSIELKPPHARGTSIEDQAPYALVRQQPF